MLPNNWKLIFASACALAFTSCGGGGGSNTPPASGGSAGGATNAAPAISINVSDMSPVEGLKSTLDASATTDANGDTLTFSWTQLSGPTLEFSASSAAETEISVPNLTADIPARIQLQVSDGKVTTTQEVTLDLTNLMLTPLIESTFAKETDFEYVKELVEVESIGGIYYLLHRDGDNFGVDRFYFGESNVFTLEDGVIQSGSILDLNTDGIPQDRSRSWFLGAIGNNSIEVFESGSESRGPRLTIPIANVCSIAKDFEWAAGHSVVGKRDGGLTIVEVIRTFAGNGIEALVAGKTINPSENFCDLQFVFESLEPGSGINTPDGHRLLAVNSNSNEIVEFSVVREDAHVVDLIEKSRTPLELDVPDGVEMQYKTSMKFDSSNSVGMALVFTDGQTEGYHRLVVIGASDSGAPYQEVYQWDYGVPSKIRSVTVGDHKGDSLFVITEDSPYAVIFESGVERTLPDHITYLPLSGPKYFDLGVGALDASDFLGVGTSGILAAFPKEKLIKIYEK